jgi:hypothetical protein
MIRLPSFRISISHAGGIIQIGATTIEWANAVPPGTQLMGQPQWGWTAVIFPTDYWFFGR